VQEEDFALGVIALFVSAILGFIVICVVVIWNSDMSDTEPSRGPAKSYRQQQLKQKTGGYN
jgi:hypothetical protein